MSYTVLSWEVSTGDAARAARITAAAEQALAAFSPAPLLVSCFILDSETQNVEAIRRALDGVAAGFPQEFFYTTAKQAEGDIQGIYPPFADLGAAHRITGSRRNPLPRTVPAAVPGIAAAPVGRPVTRRGAPVVIAGGPVQRRRKGKPRKAGPKVMRQPSGRGRSRRPKGRVR
jgi:hypothetical protein